MPDVLTTPPIKDISSAPRMNFATLNPIGSATAFPQPSILYLTAAAVDGTSTINITDANGVDTDNVPIYQQGKFDLVNISKLRGSSGITAAWRAF